ncbi:MAG: GNAT family N-acetyltransferase [Chloroflexi bacterium]|nr:GNAT family N-acetyltransferase [Chloroflexota bacterium]
MSSSIEIRPATWLDWPDFRDVLSTAFGDEMSDDGRAQWESFLEFDRGRMVAAFDQGGGQAGRSEQMIGTGGWFGVDMTVPGGELPTAAITMVSVRPSHTRRGTLRGLMRRMLDDARAQGFPLATLIASEASIYQRFGYGLAYQRALISVDPRRATFLNDPGPVGAIRMLTAEEALDLLPPIYEQARQAHPASFKRSALWWEKRTLCDLPGARRGGGPRRWVLLTVDRQPQGYVIYNVTQSWEPSALSTSTLQVVEAVGVSPVATRELWRYLFGVDLVARIETYRLCEGHPLPLMLTDPRQLRLSSMDGTWVRLIELEPALTARRYLTTSSLTFELADEFCPWNSGVWRLDAGPDSASLTRSAAGPDLRLSAAALASMYLGTVKASSLLRAGRLDELTPGAAHQADLLFGWTTPPWCLDNF